MGRVETSLRRKLLFGSILFSITVVLGLLLAEVLLRLVPIPGITFHTFYYDSVTGGKHYPGSTLIYRDDRGNVVKRQINDWGFVDVDHRMMPELGVTRLAFFGDSYVEARQVKHEDFFVPLVEAQLNAGTRDATRYEAIAFGMSGRSTLQSYLESRQWSKRARLDWEIYVFVENDPGNQLRETNQVDTAPYMIRKGDAFAIDSSFAELYAHKARGPHRATQYLKSRSLVFSTLHQRLRLLLRQGVKMHVTDLDRDVGAMANSAPSTWTSPELADEAWASVEWVLERWANEARAAGRRFAVVNVPRDEKALHTPLSKQDAWAPRLHEFCRRAGILLIDPVPELARASSMGDEIFYDHFTPEGHRAFARAIAIAIEQEISQAE